MKIHIAGRHELRRKARGLADRLEDAGHRVVSRWIRNPGRNVGIAERAGFTLTDLLVADCVVFLAESSTQAQVLPGSSERHVEFGYALKAGKKLCVLGPRETEFCHLDQVARFRTIGELVDALR